MIGSERGALWLSLTAALAMALLALVFALATDSRVILLDGLYNAVYFLVGLFTLRAARLVQTPDNARFPFGHGYFESLVNAAKGLLILGVSLIALVDALLTITAGGRPIVAGLAMLYAGGASVVCGLTALVLGRVARRVDSPLVRADVTNWILNAVISASLVAGFAAVPLLVQLGWSAATPFVDPVLVAAVVVLLIGMPVRLARDALFELLNRAPGDALQAAVEAAIDRATADLPVVERRARVVRPGRTLYAAVHIVLPPDWPVGRLDRLDAVRARIDDAVRAIQPRLLLDIVFTAEPYWAAPNAGTQPPPALSSSNMSP
ncbi:MAG: cation diffusion facilitator family transporter [Halochromatium sp.]|uniref:cation diffusion facilitator family transporter n=1 Tax=Halochromatium sp. TaxID=2049430 RepID=UPI00397E05E7